VADFAGAEGAQNESGYPAHADGEGTSDGEENVHGRGHRQRLSTHYLPAGDGHQPLQIVGHQSAFESLLAKQFFASSHRVWVKHSALSGRSKTGAVTPGG